MDTSDADPVHPAAWHVAGHTLKVTHLEKPYWPQAGFTKGDMLQYYLRVAPVILPHLRDRPVTLRMYPDGVDGQSYYQRACPDIAPTWLRATPYRTKTVSHTAQLPLVDDAAELIWLVNAGAIEFHTWGARLPDLTLPDQAIFDLDPGETATFAEVLQAAQRVYEALGAMGVTSYPKTSGGRGVHIVVPFASEPGLSFEHVRAWVKTVAQRLAAADPRLLALPHGSTHQGGRVTIDFAQNSVGRNTAAPYTLRASAAHPVVSMPLTWQEVEVGGFLPEELTPQVVLGRVQRLGDLFIPVLLSPQRLPPTSPTNTIE